MTPLLKVQSLWMVHDKETGLFKLQGAYWGKRGRVWSLLAHVKSSIDSVTFEYMDAHPDFQLLATYHFFGHGYVDRVNPADAPAYRELMDTWTAQRYDKKSRYSYLPESWVVLRQADGAWTEFCTCREVYDKKEPA